jgi:hypothetical protein
LTPETPVCYTLRAIAAAIILAIPVQAFAQTTVPDSLEQARVAYNDARYSEAVDLATKARSIPAISQAATVIFARAHLEQFRQTFERADLAAAREALRSVDISMLSPRDRVERLIALGVSLYLDDEHSLGDRFSAAAEQFEVALSKPDVLDATSRDLLFDWWAGSLDRQAQQGPESDRTALYRRILARSEDELKRNESSVSASYWLAASARGTYDLPRAAGAAMAGWIRAGALADRGQTLRNDLDRLMLQVILPERAREIATDSDPRPTLEALEEEWTQVKQKWTR